MCTGIVETVEVSGSGKGPHGWFKLEQVNVSYDHPTDASLEHALNIDFVNQSEGPSSRVAVELSPESARNLVKAILDALSQTTITPSNEPNRLARAREQSPPSRPLNGLCPIGQPRHFLLSQSPASRDGTGNNSRRSQSHLG